MERDVRRAVGQWRGCYAFEDITCDGEGITPKRTGGLKMGQTYYYYVCTRALEVRIGGLTVI
jgi:hypothetical protein